MIHSKLLLFSIYPLNYSEFSKVTKLMEWISLFRQKVNLLKWPTGCGPTNPAMVGYERKAQESSCCSAHKEGCLPGFQYPLESPESSL